jgi:HEAT repeat protein
MHTNGLSRKLKIRTLIFNVYAFYFLCLAVVCAASDISAEYKVLIKELVASKACRPISNKIYTLNNRNLLPIGPLAELLEHDSPIVRYNAAYTISILQNRKQYTAKLIEAARKEGDVKTLLILVKALRDSAATPLLSDLMINHTSVKVRRAAIYSLVWISDPNAVLSLIEAMRDSSVASEAISALGKIGDSRAIPRLIEIIEQEEQGVRGTISAVKALGGIGSSKATPVLRKLLQSQEVPPLCEAVFFYEVVYALARTYDDKVPYSFTPLLELVKDDSPTIRQSAARAMRQARNSDQCVGALIAAASKEHNIYALHQMIGALQTFKDSATTPLLSDLMVNHKSPEIRYAAVSCQDSISDANAVPSLIAATGDPIPKVSVGAINLLGKIGDSRAIPRLVEIIEQKEQGTLSAVQALGMIGSANGASVLRSLLQSEKIEVLKGAIWALGGAYDDKTVSSLCPLLEHEDEDIANKARESLLRIGNDEVMMHFVNNYQRYPNDTSVVEMIRTLRSNKFSRQDITYTPLKELPGDQMSALAKHLSKVSKKNIEPKQIRLKGRLDKTIFVSVILDYDAYESHRHYGGLNFIVIQMDNGIFRGARILSRWIT